jgi:hypothetical protein
MKIILLKNPGKLFEYTFRSEGVKCGDFYECIVGFNSYINKKFRNKYLPHYKYIQGRICVGCGYKEGSKILIKTFVSDTLRIVGEYVLTKRDVAILDKRWECEFLNHPFLFLRGEDVVISEYKHE